MRTVRLAVTHEHAMLTTDWPWNGKPNAHDLRLFGGSATVRSLVSRFPVGARVRWCQRAEEWIVESLFIVGSTSPMESWVETDFPGDKRFWVALRDATRRVRESLRTQGASHLGSKR